VVSGETVHSGGVLDLFLKGASASETVLESGGELNISGNATVDNIVLDGGSVLETQSPKAFVSGSLVFAGAATIKETDIISGGFGISATISGWQAGDVIDISSYSSATLTSAVVSGNTDVTVTDSAVTDGTTSQTFTFAGTDFADNAFVLQSDGTGGVELTFPCFVTGTRILTERGEVAVEDLVVGDLVVTVSGASRPIRWIGHRHVDCGRHLAPENVQPVRVPAHAFGLGLPARDLLLSPDHALFAEGVLVPVKHLIGTGGIAPIAVESLTYWHVELDQHDVLLAEGLPAESYLDTGDRNSFANGGGTLALHPLWGSERTDVSLIMEALGYAPLRVAGPEVELIRAALRKNGETPHDAKQTAAA
jgi:autotransporter passenger strand-loop-strand repeat protein